MREILAQHIRYIRKRDNGIYQYERRVPEAVKSDPTAYRNHFGSRPLFRRSLGTRSQTEALRAGERVHLEFEGYLIRASGGNSQPHDVQAVVVPQIGRPVTPELLERLSKERQRFTVRQWSQMKIWAESSEQQQKQLEDMIEEREMWASDLRKVLFENKLPKYPGLPNIPEIAEQTVRREGLNAPPQSVEFNLVSRAIREGIIAGEREVDDLLEDRESVFRGVGEVQAVAPRIAEAVDAHIAFLSKARTIAELRGALREFVALHGDLRLDEIKRRHFQEYCAQLAARTVGGKDGKSVGRPMAADTIRKKVRLLGAAINRAIKTGRFEGANPAEKIDVAIFAKPQAKHMMPAKRAFDVKEVNAIFQHPWFTGCASVTNIHCVGSHRLSGMHYWVPLMALYTGCRAGELAGLKLTEIDLDDQYPNLLIIDNEYRTTKRGYSRRVPILDALVAQGFEALVEKARKDGNKRLFEDWTPPGGKIDPNATAWSNGVLLRAFNRTVIQQSLGPLPPGTRKAATFHSFRGAFKTMLQRKAWSLPRNYINEVVGHSKGELDERYTGEVPISETYPAMKACNYDGLVLPPLLPKTE